MTTSYSRTSDDLRAQGFLLWARSEKIAISRLKLGDIEIDVAADLALAPSAPSLANPRPTEDLYEVFGGEALKRLREQGNEQLQADPMVEEDDGG